MPHLFLIVSYQWCPIPMLHGVLSVSSFFPRFLTFSHLHQPLCHVVIRSLDQHLYSRWRLIFKYFLVKWGETKCYHSPIWVAWPSAIYLVTCLKNHKCSHALWPSNSTSRNLSSRHNSTYRGKRHLWVNICIQALYLATKRLNNLHVPLWWVGGKELNTEWLNINATNFKKPGLENTCGNK